MALVLLFLNFLSPSFARFHDRLSIAVLPMRQIVNKPIQWAYAIGHSLQSQQQLLETNERLHANNLLLQSQVQRLLALQKENQQLEQLLQSTSHLSGKVKVSQILAVSLSPQLQQVVLGAGTDQGVYQNQPVLDSYGVMGQVVDVGYLTSKVLLITDPRSAVPVQDYRNNLRGIAIGTGSMNHLRLIDVPLLADVKVGDLFVTSGFGLHYPVGYPVGVVTNVNRNAGQDFLQVTILPSAHLDQTQRVLLAWPSQLQLQQHVKQMQSKKLPKLEMPRT